MTPQLYLKYEVGDKKKAYYTVLNTAYDNKRDSPIYKRKFIVKRPFAFRRKGAWFV